ncbi:MAG: protein-L-isoaspartate O-methyltransferase family protein [Devosia sp.]
MHRRSLLGGAACFALASAYPAAVMADVPTPYDWNEAPPTDDRAAFIAWMVKNRGEDPVFLGERYDRFRDMLSHHDLWDDRNKRAFLMTPRERFVTAANINRAYQVHYLDIGYGVTITGPNTVGRMTNSIDVRSGERVLEIGTGSGYQSAYLSNLTDQVYSIEIIKPLFERTGALYEQLISSGYTEYKAINRRNADGYYGWPEAAPFDKIIVTCGIDHIPPDLLRQLKPDGLMVIPVGPPGVQHVLKVMKRAGSAGTFTVTRSDIYGGAIVNFVPFTKLENGRVHGTHSG